MGFTKPLQSPAMLVGSYPTISPLPCGATEVTPRWRFIFCCTFPSLTAGRRYRPSCSAEPGLSSRGRIHQRSPDQLGLEIVVGQSTFSNHRFTRKLAQRWCDILAAGLQRRLTASKSSCFFAFLFAAFEALQKQHACAGREIERCRVNLRLRIRRCHCCALHEQLADWVARC